MTTLYVSSVDGNNGTPPSVTWWNGSQATYATVAGALAALSGAGPHVIYVDSAHSFTATAAITWNTPSSMAVAILSVDRSTGAFDAGALEAVGAANAAFNVATVGSPRLYIYGFDLAGGTNANLASDFNIATGTAIAAMGVTFKSCILRTPAASGGALFNMGKTSSLGAGPPRLSFEDCEFVVHSSTSAAFNFSAVDLEFTRITISFSGTEPLSLFVFNNSASAHIDIRDCDLSGYNTTGGAYFDVSSFVAGHIHVVNCKLGSTPAFITGTWPNNRGYIQVINTDSGDTHNVFRYYNRLGTITESTSVYADDGATFDGSHISWQIVTSAECSEHQVFVTPWLYAWTPSTGSALNYDLEILRDSATDYTDREVWGEFETLENSSFPVGTLTSTRNAVPFVGTGSDLTNSGVTWTEGMTNDNEMRVRVTRTPVEKSLAAARLCVGVASTTLYLDPKLRIAA